MLQVPSEGSDLSCPSCDAQSSACRSILAADTFAFANGWKSQGDLAFPGQLHVRAASSAGLVWYVVVVCTSGRSGTLHVCSASFCGVEYVWISAAEGSDSCKTRSCVQSGRCDRPRKL